MHSIEPITMYLQKRFFKIINYFNNVNNYINIYYQNNFLNIFYTVVIVWEQHSGKKCLAVASQKSGTLLENHLLCYYRLYIFRVVFPVLFYLETTGNAMVKVHELFN